MGSQTSRGGGGGGGGDYFCLSKVLTFSPFKDPQVDPFFFFFFACRMARGQEATSTN